MIFQAPSRGEIWQVNLDPTWGQEQAGQLPGLVVSVDPFNHGPAGLVVIIPVTSRARKILLHVQINPPEGGLTQVSFIKCEDVRSVSRERLTSRRGSISSDTMTAVEERLGILLGL